LITDQLSKNIKISSPPSLWAWWQRWNSPIF